MEALFISENFLRTNFQISENLQSQFLIPAIRNAQFIKYQSIIGEGLYKRLVNDIVNNSLTADYKDLLEHSKMYLAYSAMVELCVISNIKINNIGINIASDDRVQTLGVDDMFRIKDYFQHQADFYCKDLQNYLLNNRAKFPELSECQCRSIKSNLYSAASCFVNLGGARGKRVWRTT